MGVLTYGYQFQEQVKLDGSMPETYADWQERQEWPDEDAMAGRYVRVLAGHRKGHILRITGRGVSRGCYNHLLRARRAWPVAGSSTVISSRLCAVIGECAECAKQTSGMCIECQEAARTLEGE